MPVTVSVGSPLTFVTGVPGRKVNTDPNEASCKTRSWTGAPDLMVNVRLPWATMLTVSAPGSGG